MSGKRPLDGLKVLDFTHVLAGPFATRVLGDMGADVVKINSVSRALAANDPVHPYYLMWNRNKRALALDMSNPDSRPLCRALCEQADVVIDEVTDPIGLVAAGDLNAEINFLFPPTISHFNKRKSQ